MNAGSLVRHDVIVVKECADLPPLPLDRHRVLQILVNLISNTNQAMDATTGRPHRLTLRVALADGATGQRSLQICVLAAGEMGGTLTARSEGAGHGAVFTLEIPLQAEGLAS